MRKVYNFYEYLGDMGGLFGILQAISVILVNLLDCKRPGIEYLTHFYKVSDEDKKDGDIKVHPGQS